MTTRSSRPLRFPQLTVPCPWCRAPAGTLCAAARGRVRRDNTHDARRHTWAITAAVCPTCHVEPGTPCRGPNGYALPAPHPARDAEAARTQPTARRPHIDVLGDQLDLTKETDTP